MLDYLTASYIIGCGNPKDDPTQEAALLRLQILTYLDSLSEKELYDTISAGIYSCASFLRNKTKNEALDAITRRRDKATKTYIYSIVRNGGTLYGLEFEDYLQEVCLKIMDRFFAGNTPKNDLVKVTLQKLPSRNRDLKKATEEFLTNTKEEWDTELAKADFTEAEFKSYAKEECDQKLKKFKEIVKAFPAPKGYADKVWEIFLYNLSAKNWYEDSIKQFDEKTQKKKELFEKEARKYLNNMYKEWENYLSKNHLTNEEFEEYLKKEIPEAVKTFKSKFRDFDRTSMIGVLDNIIFDSASSVISKEEKNWEDKDKDKEVDWDEYINTYINTKSGIAANTTVNIKTALKQFRNNLDEEEQKFFDLMCQGNTMKEIKEKLGLPQSTTYDRRKRIAQKAKAEGLI